MAAASNLRKTLLVVLGISLACSFVVSTAAIKLQGLQRENQRQDRLRNILVAGGLYREGREASAIYAERIEPELVELATGRRIGPEGFDEALHPEAFDIDALAHDPDYGEAIPAAIDAARIGRRPRRMVVYFIREGDRFQGVILPVHGRGLWSTLYGFLALEADLRTVAGITFYRHGETPGLGGEVDNPRWKSGWKGKQAFNEAGGLAIQVLKHAVDPASDRARHQIDGLAGASITTRGVNNLVRYWLGEHGYGPFLASLRKDLPEPGSVRGQ